MCVVNVGESFVTTSMMPGQSFVVRTQQMQNSRVQIRSLSPFFNRTLTEIVCVP